MISRVWHGWTDPENADTYEDMLLSRILPGIRAKGIPGYRGAHAMRRDHAGEVEFITVLWFDSLDAVRDFVGEDHEVAYVPEEARAVLGRFDHRSQHYDVLLSPEEGT